MTDRMTPAEAVMLCRFAKACCPQQQFDEYTPDAWFELLRDLRFIDCKDAIIQVAKGQPFVSPSEIRQNMMLVRANRLERFGYATPPPDLSLAEENEYRKNVERQVADGLLTREQYDAQLAAEGRLGDRKPPRALEEAFRIPGDVR